MGKRLRVKDMKVGYDLGFLDGKDHGLEVGRVVGYDDGYKDGWTAAFQLAKKMLNDEFSTTEVSK